MGARGGSFRLANTTSLAELGPDGAGNQGPEIWVKQSRKPLEKYERKPLTVSPVQLIAACY